MAKPRVFLSSTFYDLKQVRSSLENFIISLGYEPVLSEKGSIAYSPDVALDESCYREAKGCDVFVLIIGGRYGSEISESDDVGRKGFYDRYESITRKEYESALEREIPTYVLMEKSVLSEYETFKRNRDNQTINYAHVDSVNIFGFIDYILARPRNNPTYHFELASEIETWLREQWAGLFRELIRSSADRAQISSLAAQVTDLTNVSATLTRYLEEVLARVGDKKEAREIISEEEAKLSNSRMLAEFAKMPAIRALIRDRQGDDISIETARDIFSSAISLNDLARRVEKASNGSINAERVTNHWRATPSDANDMNEVRRVLGLAPLRFEENLSANAQPAGKRPQTKSS
ncbi:MAG TPA: DUF4062 domain-containing protein [Bryobacteraceae bacterium]|nr:DUF4062 domain-containing protein [Bryobacteraceae bacterium]